MKIELKMAKGYAEIRDEWRTKNETKYLEALYLDGQMSPLSFLRANRVLALELTEKIVIDEKEIAVSTDSLDELYPKDYDVIVGACVKIQAKFSLNNPEKKN